MALLLGLLSALLLGPRAGLRLAGGGRRRARGTRCRPDRGSASCAATLAPPLPAPPPTSRFLFAKGGRGGACSPYPPYLPLACPDT